MALRIFRAHASRAAIRAGPLARVCIRHSTVAAIAIRLAGAGVPEGPFAAASELGVGKADADAAVAVAGPGAGRVERCIRAATQERCRREHARQRGGAVGVLVALGPEARIGTSAGSIEGHDHALPVDAVGAIEAL